MSPAKKSTFADILKDVAGEEKRRMEAKVPSWASIPGLSFPSRLSTEQCSSEATALYKASLASGFGSGLEIADLTGGLGVDSWAFARAAVRVLHNEMNEELSSAVRSNFARMGIRNVEFRSVEITASTVDSVLEDFFSAGSERIVFMDPARRSASGSKVFRLEDCTPNVLGLLPKISVHAARIILKLSPMADIDLLMRQLDSVSPARCRMIHIVASGGECKEILAVMERGWNGDCMVTCAEEDFRFTFSPAEEKSAHASPAGTEGLEGKYLFEPGKSLTKAGAFKLISERFGIAKFGISTHLYLSDSPVEDIPGKWFRIEKSMPFDKASIKAAGKEYPRCEVTARNLPITSDELRRRLGSKSGGPFHIFALHADTGAKNLLLVTTPAATES